MDEREREITRGAAAELACAELRERLAIVEKENEELAQLWRGEQKQTIECSRLLHDAEKALRDHQPHEDPRRTEYVVKLERQVESAQRAGIIEGENEYARWLDRKGHVVTDGDDEKAVDALARYRMGRGW